MDKCQNKGRQVEIHEKPYCLHIFGQSYPVTLNSKERHLARYAGTCCKPITLGG